MSDFERELKQEERRNLRRAQGLSTDLEDITEVEYRKLRLERVVLVGAYADPDTQENANRSLLELASLCETAGAEVLGSIKQKRKNLRAPMYIGRGR